MKQGIFRQLFSLRDLRNGLLAVAAILGGAALSAVTLYAHRAGDTRVAGVAAAVSLVFVLLILVFVVPPLARNASKEASQLNLPFEFTMGGAIMLGLLVIVGFSAWNTGNNLLFLVLSFLTAAMVIGFAAGGIMLKKVDVKMRFPDTIFAGEETPIFVGLDNRKRLFASYSVVAEVRGVQREESAAAEDLRRFLPTFIASRLSRAPVIRRTLDYFAYIPSGCKAENRTLHVFPERGRLMIRDFEISTRFPFAFFRHRRRLPAKETELIVFPRLEPLKEGLEKIVLDTGNTVTQKKGSGQDLLALRDYQPNDDLRRVDWKATARARNLIVREFLAEDDLKVTVILDDRIPLSERPTLTAREIMEQEQKGLSPLRSERFEEGVRMTASLLSYYTDLQAEICLIIGSEKGSKGIGAAHLHECLRRLAVAEPSWSPKAVAESIFDPEIAEDEIVAETSLIVLTTVPAAELPEALKNRASISNF